MLFGAWVDLVDMAFGFSPWYDGLSCLCLPPPGNTQLACLTATGHSASPDKRAVFSLVVNSPAVA
eukprot:806510-Karenia_brevis.AAC.1